MRELATQRAEMKEWQGQKRCDRLARESQSLR
jgi:hypothetical protein